MLRTLGVVAALAFLLVTVAPAGSPVQMSYVYSDSMEPTIGTGDAFLVVASGDVSVGDVVTFRDERRREYVTHRVVGRSDGGFITKGDANPTTDQAAGHPPVERSDVIGEVVTYGGDPVTVPGYGAVVTVLRAHQRLALAAAAALGLVALARSTGGDSGAARTRFVSRQRDLLVPLFAAGAAAVVALVVLRATVRQFEFVATTAASTAPHVLTVGESLTTTVTVERAASPLTTAVVDADGMALANQTRNASTISLSARVPPPEATGRHVARVAVYRHPAILPRALLAALTRVHPVLAAGASALALVGPPALGTMLAVEGGTPIRPSRSRWAHRLAEVLR